LREPSEPDIVRLEAMKLLEYARISDSDHYRLLGMEIVRILRTPEEGLLRDYAVMAAANLFDVGGIVEKGKNILLRQDESIDTRWNAFAFLRRAGNNRHARMVLNRLEQDRDFAQAARELLEQWKLRSGNG